MNVYGLLIHNPETGIAQHLCGVLAIHNGQHHVSWVPDVPNVTWLDKFAAAEEHGTGIADSVAHWIDNQNGVTWGIDLIDDSPAQDNPVDAAEATIDLILGNPDSRSLFPA